MADTEGSRTKLDARTWVPIGLLAGILVIAITATATVVGGFKDITATQAELILNSSKTAKAVEDQGRSIQNLSDDMYRMRVDLNGVLNDPWHQKDMKFWVLAAQQAFDRANVKVDLPPVQAVESGPAQSGDRK